MSMQEFKVTCLLDRHHHFLSQLDILYRLLWHAVILAAVFFGAFWIVFFADFAKNGTMISWGITGSLMYMAIVVCVMVVVYIAYSPLHALIKASWIARNAVETAPYDVTFGKNNIKVVLNDETSRTFDWLELKIFRETKRFLILRERTKKKQLGQLILPKKDVSAEEITQVKEYLKEVRLKEEIRTNPVARERARQAEERKQKERAMRDAAPVFTETPTVSEEPSQETQQNNTDERS